MIVWVHRIFSGLCRRVRVRWLQMLGVKIGKRCWIQAVEIPRNHFDVHLADRVALDRAVVLVCTGPRGPRPRITVQSGVYINRFTMLDAAQEIAVGANTMIGPHCYITDHDHGTSATAPISSQPLIGAPVKIGSDVWIGSGVTILKGVRVGDGAVIAAGTVVTRNVAPRAKVAGVPARQIGVRT